MTLEDFKKMVHTTFYREMTLTNTQVLALMYFKFIKNNILEIFSQKST